MPIKTKLLDLSDIPFIPEEVGRRQPLPIKTNYECTPFTPAPCTSSTLQSLIIDSNWKSAWAYRNNPVRVVYARARPALTGRVFRNSYEAGKFFGNRHYTRVHRAIKSMCFVEGCTLEYCTYMSNGKRIACEDVDTTRPLKKGRLLAYPAP